jgi:hypothetical protein
MAGEGWGMVGTGAVSGADTGSREAILCGSIRMAFRLAICPVGLLACPPFPPSPLSSPTGAERGSEQPHLISSPQLTFYWRSTQRAAGASAVAGGALADATKSNVAVGPPLARWARGWGRVGETARLGMSVGKTAI